MRALISITLVSSGLAFGQYSPPTPQPIPCLLITPGDAVNLPPLVEHIECIETITSSTSNPVAIAPSQFTELKAGERIHLTSATSIQPSQGAAWLHIEKPADYELAWFYPQGIITPFDTINSGVALRHEKLEFGVDLPADIEQDIADFFDVNVNGVNELNPYNPQDIRISAVFRKGGISQKVVDAFYYREMQRDVPSDSWNEVSTDFHWRVRFAPEQTGTDWDAEVTVHAVGHTPFTFQFNFTVIESNNPGFLEVGQFNEHLRHSHTQESRFLIGQNIAWLDAPVIDSVSNVQNPNLPSNLQDFTRYAGWVQSLADNGGNTFRLVACPWSSQWEWEALGNYDPAQDFAWEMDRLVDQCHDNDMYMLYCMLLHMPHIDLHNDFFPTWEDNPYNSANNDPTIPQEFVSGIIDPLDYFTNSQTKQLTKNYLRYLLSRWGYSTNIWGWQLFSEIDGLEFYKDELDPTDCSIVLVDNTLNRETIFNWMDEMFNYLNDTLDSEQLISSAPGGHPCNTRGIHDGRIYEHPAVDFLGSHTYSIDIENNPDQFRNRNSLTRFEVSQNWRFGEPEIQHGNTTVNFPNIANKPFLFDEFGVFSVIPKTFMPDTVIFHNKDWVNCLDVMFHNDMWATACMGTMGTGLSWNAWPNDGFRAANFPGISSFFNDIDFEGHNFSFVRRWPFDETDIESSDQSTYKNNGRDILEAFMVSELNGDRSFGWIHNRSYYWYNLRHLYPCLDDLINGTGGYDKPYLEEPGDDDASLVPVVASQSTGPPNHARFRIFGLDGVTKYRVDYYDTRTGLLVGTQTKISNISGTLKLKLSVVLDEDRPDVAYKCYKDNSSWQMETLFADGDMMIESDQLTQMGHDESDEEEINAYEALIHPNPSSDVLYIQFVSRDHISNVNVIIRDISGRIVKRSVLTGEETRLNVSDLRSGVYLVEIRKGEEVFHQEKLIHQ